MGGVSTSVGDLGTILSVWAHPDDETYLSGGIMAMARDLGQRVVCVSATAGEHGTDDPATWPPARLGALRRTEAAAAMRILGVEDHRWLDFEDGALAAMDPDAGIEPIARLIEEIAPDTILTFGPDGATFHPDHITIHHWVTEAWKRCDEPGALLYFATAVEAWTEIGPLLEGWGVYMTDDRPVPVAAADLAIDLRLPTPVLDRKIAALTAMDSQIGPALAVIPPADFRTVNSIESFVSA